MVKVDAHAYVGESLFGLSRTPEALLAEMDRLGIDRAVLCPSKPLNYDLPSANRLVEAAVKQHPDRFIGWVRVDPWQGARALSELRGGIEIRGLVGLLLHPYEELFQIANREIDPLIAYAAEQKFPVMVECGYHLHSHPFDLAELAKRFPEVTFIGTHGLQLDDAGFALTDADFVMKECGNIVMESSGMYAPDNMVQVVEKLGSERLVFGSHSPWLNLEFELDRIDRLAISDAQKEAVFGGTILKLLGKS